MTDSLERSHLHYTAKYNYRSRTCIHTEDGGSKQEQVVLRFMEFDQIVNSNVPLFLIRTIAKRSYTTMLSAHSTSIWELHGRRKRIHQKAHTLHTYTYSSGFDDARTNETPQFFAWMNSFLLGSQKVLLVELDMKIELDSV